MSKYKIAVVGAGIYGSTIANKLAATGHKVNVYDPLGILNAASSINQFRIHSGYHYPRSPETIAEILESRAEFTKEYRDSFVEDANSYYAIPHEGSRTPVATYEETMASFGLNLKSVRPSWIDFNFIQKCYLVDEKLYNPDILRTTIEDKFRLNGIEFFRELFPKDGENDYDFTIYATYGASGGYSHMFESVKLQVAEKVLVKLPSELQKVSLVVIDGPFSAFDAYSDSEYSQFGSALYTNHWQTTNPHEMIPEIYAPLINEKNFRKVSFSNFGKMREDAAKAVPLSANAEYIGSRFTLRLVENDPSADRRVLHIGQSDDHTFHVFSGKVISAVKAARVLASKIDNA